MCSAKAIIAIAAQDLSGLLPSADCAQEKMLDGTVQRRIAVQTQLRCAHVILRTLSSSASG
jgi:hypothetical protein